MRNYIVTIVLAAVATASMTELELAVAEDVSEYLAETPRRLEALVRFLNESFKRVYHSRPRLAPEVCLKEARKISGIMGEGYPSVPGSLMSEYYSLCIQPIVSIDPKSALPVRFSEFLDCQIHATIRVSSILSQLASVTTTPAHSDPRPQCQVAVEFANRVIHQATTRRLALLNLPARWAVAAQQYEEYMQYILAEPFVTKAIAAAELRDSDPQLWLIYGPRSGKVVRRLAAGLRDKWQAALNEKFPGP